MALSHVRVRLLVLAVVVAALGLAAGMVLPQPSSAQNVGGPPPNCGEDCEYAGEQYMNYTQCGTNHEGIAFKLERTGPDTFTALVCLYNYEGMPVACNRNSVCGYDGVGNHRFVPPGVDSKVWELVGPPGENIWKARWFICGGSGNVTLRGDPFCSDGCLGQTNCTAPANPVCEPDQCDEQFLNTVRRPPPYAPVCCARLRARAGGDRERVPISTVDSLLVDLRP